MTPRTSCSMADQPGANADASRYGAPMGHLKEAMARSQATQLGGDDPWTVPLIRQWMHRARSNGTLVQSFPSLLHAAETVQLEQLWALGDGSAEAQALLDDLCHGFEASAERPPPPRLRLALTTTNTFGSLEQLLRSLCQELLHSRWSHRAPGVIDVLVVENDTVPEVQDGHQRTIARFTGATVGALRLTVHHVGWREKGGLPANRRPWTGARSRAFLLHQIASRGWCPTRSAPVWLLDEDMLFSSLAPDPVAGWTMTRIGSILHRLEVLSKTVPADAVVGGNTGAAPVPALGLLKHQARDLASHFASGDGAKGLQGWSRAVESIQRAPEYYYDLAEAPIVERAVGLPAAWWRAEDGPDADEGPLLDLCLRRLAEGQPVTRPLPARLDPEFGSAWGAPAPTIVAGGNVLLLSERCLNPSWVVDLPWSGGRSRRADSAWVALAGRAGARVVSLNMPLYHARRHRQQVNSVRESAGRLALTLQSQMTADVIGVALYRTVAALGAPSMDSAWWTECRRQFNLRRERVTGCLEAAREALGQLLNLGPNGQQANMNATPWPSADANALVRACELGIEHWEDLDVRRSLHATLTSAGLSQRGEGGR